MASYNPTPLVPNNAFLALFRLEVHDANGAFMNGYTFPLTPASVKRTYVGMGNHWDVQSPPDNAGTGITRVIDWYGNAAPIFTIEGTTGYQAHPTVAGGTNSLLPGVTSAGVLNKMLYDFSVSNAEIIARGEPNLLTMRFLDYYRADFWQVMPLGEQLFAMDNQRPLYVNYRFRLVGVNDLGGPQIPVADEMAIVFGQTPIDVAAQAVDFINRVQATESQVTILQSGAGVGGL